MRIIPLLAEEGWRVAPGWSVRPKCVAGLLLRLRPSGLALRALLCEEALHKKCMMSGSSAVAAVYEDTHEPRLKVKDENARPNASKGLTAIFSLQL